MGGIPLFTDTNAVTQIDFVATEITANAFCISHFPFSIFRFHKYFIFIRFLSICQLMRLKMFSIIFAAFAE